MSKTGKNLRGTSPKPSSTNDVSDVKAALKASIDGQNTQFANKEDDVSSTNDQTKTYSADRFTNDTISGETALTESVGDDTTRFGREIKRYADNPQNRRLNRVGLPIGTKVFSAKTGSVVTKVYRDTPENERLKRVGMPLGCMPKRNVVLEKGPEMVEKQMGSYTTEVRGKDKPSQVALLTDEFQRNLQLTEHSWRTNGSLRTDMSLLADYNGKRIDIGDLKLHSVIGRGRFGEVYFAKLREVAVAVKKMKVENITEKDVTSFTKEVMNFCKLNHPNIVTFIGACTVMPDLCIVMEYMQFSLFDAIHTRGIKFTDTEKLNIMRQICEGMKYLHGMRIAHCDVKSANILMDYVKNKICEVKITDLGLSMMLPGLSLSLSQAKPSKLAQHIGTPRYSAPEILRGESLGIRDMMHADVYSLGLLLYEVVFEEEPYQGFTAIQMREDVGEKGITPDISGELQVDEDILDIINKTWKFQPCMRPKARNILDVLNQKSSLF